MLKDLKSRQQLPVVGSEEAKQAPRLSRGNPLFGAKLRKLRESRDLSQKRLCNEIYRLYNVRMHDVTISRLENGLQTPMTQEICAFYKYFNCNLEWLISDDAPLEGYKIHLEEAMTLVIEIVQEIGPIEAIRRLKRQSVATPESPTIRDVSPAIGVHSPQGTKRQPG